MEREEKVDKPLDTNVETVDSPTEDISHATTGGAAAAGAVTGGVIGLTGGPIGAAIGAVGGAIVGVAAERMMHSEDESVDGLGNESQLDSSATSVRPPRDTEQ